MRILFMGTPQFASPSLKALVDAGYNVIGVITQPDRACGRGGVIGISPIKKVAMEYSIPVYQPFSLKKDSFLSVWESLSPDLVVVVAYGLILPPWVMHASNFGCINVHASLLPKYRGATPINWAIIKGEKITGVTTILMDEGLDTGDILLQESIEIYSDDTAETLSGRLSNLAAEVLLETIGGIIEKKLKPIPQPSFIEKYLYTTKLTKDMGLILWDRDAVIIDRLIKGLFPWPGSYTFLYGHRFKILKSSISRKIFDNSKAVPGQIMDLDQNEGLLVRTGSGCLAILEIQPENKKKMDIWSFVAGFRSPLVGQIFTKYS